MYKQMQKLSLLMLMAMLVGCGAGTEADLTYTTGHSTHEADLDVDLTLLDNFQQPSHVFVQGEDIELQLSVTNHTDHTIVLDFETGQHYDFYVDSAFGQVWAWAENKLFDPRASSLDIPPYSTVSVSEFVDTRRFAQGSYTASGVFVGQSLSASEDFTII